MFFFLNIFIIYYTKVSISLRGVFHKIVKQLEKSYLRSSFFQYLMRLNTCISSVTLHVDHFDCCVRFFLFSLLELTKCWCIATQVFHLLHDNAPAHKSTVVTNYLQEINLKVIEHPPYSPNLAPCDIWLFPELKEMLAGRSLWIQNQYWL